jgi:spore coat polysaccharide biosynthesis predicted glycosyltransferase SpsG
LAERDEKNSLYLYYGFSFKLVGETCIEKRQNMACSAIENKRITIRLGGVEWFKATRHEVLS